MSSRRKQKTPPPRGLTPPQEAFVAAYFRLRFRADLAAAEVYGSATASAAATRGHKTLHHPAVQEAIQQRLAAEALSGAQVVQLLGDHARADLGPFLTFNKSGEASVDLEAMRDAGLSHLIKKLKRHADGSTTIELHDSQAALDKLARVHGLYRDRLDLTISTPPTPEEVAAALTAAYGKRPPPPPEDP